MTVHHKHGHGLKHPFTVLPHDDLGPANIANPLNPNNPSSEAYFKAWFATLTPEQKESYTRNSLPGEREAMFKGGYCPNPSHRLLPNSPQNPAYHCDEHYHLKWFGNLSNKAKCEYLERATDKKRDHNFKKYPGLKETWDKLHPDAHKKHEAKKDEKHHEVKKHEVKELIGTHLVCERCGHGKWKHVDGVGACDVDGCNCKHFKA